MRRTGRVVLAWLASIASTMVFFVPIIVLGLLGRSSVDPDANVSGVVLAPVLFIVGVGICHALATWLIANGYTAFARFTAGACFGAAAVVLAMAIPSVAIGCYVEMFTFRDAVAPVLGCVLGTGLLAVPASAAWWLIAGRTHNKPLQATCEDARA